MTDTDLIDAAEAPPAGAPSGMAPDSIGDMTERDRWFAQMEERCLEEGYFEPLGKRHWAWFHDDGPTLLVTFETIDSILARPERLSAGFAVASQKGWSHLCLIADGETWYRDSSVYRYFDRLVDDSFFEDFDRVVFYGAGTAGHAATAFCVTAPGSTVVAVSPRATLDPQVAGWDRRHLDGRRFDFTSRYGYAPDMTEGAGKVFLLFDPLHAEDAMHAALYRAPHVVFLKTRHLGARTEEVLNALVLLPRLLLAAGDDTLDAALFARLWRRRRRNGAYMDGLIAAADAKGQTRRTWIMAREAALRIRAPRFRRLAARLNAIFAIDDPEDEAAG
ncbi:MAG: hypothetical protein RIR62_828 [Pseudomonadota bacterium]|jgi:hypothetical protein